MNIKSLKFALLVSIVTTTIGGTSGYASSVEESLKLLKKETHTMWWRAVKNGAFHSFSTSLCIITSPLILPIWGAIDLAQITNSDVKWRIACEETLSNIKETRQFLREIEKAYVALSHKTIDSENQSSGQEVLNALSPQTLKTLSEISLNTQINIKDLIDFIHEESKNGMDDLVQKNPPFYGSYDHKVPDYLELVKTYLIEKLKT